MHMRDVLRAGLIAAALSAALSLGSCGVSTGVQTTTGNSLGSSASGPRATSSVTTGGQAVPLHATSTPASGTATSGTVRVSVAQRQYTTSDTIDVVISNGLSMAIAASDHQSSCTVVTIQREVNGAWQNVESCRLMTPTRLVEIQSGAMLTQQLAPPSSSGWPAGTYRVAFRYSSGPEGTAGTGGVVYTTTFAIG